MKHEKWKRMVLGDTRKRSDREGGFTTYWLVQILRCGLFSSDDPCFRYISENRPIQHRGISSSVSTKIKNDTETTGPL